VCKADTQWRSDRNPERKRSVIRSGIGGTPIGTFGWLAPMSENGIASWRFELPRSYCHHLKTIVTASGSCINGVHNNSADWERENAPTGIRTTPNARSLGFLSFESRSCALRSLVECVRCSARGSTARRIETLTSFVSRMLRQGFEPWSLPREGNMIGRTTPSERALSRISLARLTVVFRGTRVTAWR
jgi:hypothetical protein